jgi:hypothetical protein
MVCVSRSARSDPTECRYNSLDYDRILTEQVGELRLIDTVTAADQPHVTPLCSSLSLSFCLLLTVSIGVCSGGAIVAFATDTLPVPQLRLSLRQSVSLPWYGRSLVVFIRSLAYRWLIEAVIGSCRYQMWKALRASSAAPTYFSEVEDGTPSLSLFVSPILIPLAGPLRWMDGGLVANNPAAVALHEARCLYPGVPIDCTHCLSLSLNSLSVSLRLH